MVDAKKILFSGTPNQDKPLARPDSRSVDPRHDCAMDYTLCLSAQAWCNDPNNSLLEAEAGKWFQEFVDAYVYMPKLYATVPRKVSVTKQINEPFIELWQEDAEPLYDAGMFSPVASNERLWKRFLYSVGRYPDSWSRWIRFHWTPYMIKGFKSRVEDWRDQFNDALPEIRFAVANGHPGIEGLIRNLSEHMTAGELDRDYKIFARDQGVEPLHVACANAWNWFLRGASYRGKTQGMFARFHDLRDEAVVWRPGEGCDKLLRRKLDFSWGDILAECVRRKVIDQDASLLCDVLRTIRQVVQSDGEYRKLLRNAKGAGKAHYRNRAIGYALIKSGNPPPFREELRRARLIAAVEELSRNQKAVCFIGEIVKLGLNTKTARRIEYSLRARYAPRTLWKVFTIYEPK